MAIPRKKAPKSHKADGTPKKRWSSAERAEKGHGPRTRGGRDDRTAPWRRDDRTSDSRTTDSRDDRGGERRSFNRDDRPRSFEGRDDRGPRRFDDRAGERRSFNRDDRPRSFEGRDDRGPRRFDDRDNRGGERRSFNRDDRPRSFEGRDDRGGERRSFNRDDRPRSFEDRDNRGGDRRSFNRDDRPRSFEGRDDRGPRRFEDRDNRGGERRSFNRDDRPRNFEDRSEGRSRGWGRDDAPRHAPSRTFGDRPRRPVEPRGELFEKRREDRFDRRRDDRFDGPQDDSEADQMSWQEAEAVEVEITEAEQSSDFAGLGVALPMVAVLSKKGITEPFPIQSATIADAIAGRDVLGRGRTGSGKTLAFGLSLLTRLAAGTPVGSPRAMILTPTRELALQIADVLSPLAASVGLHLTLITGGMSYGPQLKAFERGVDIVVATPGRLIDLLEQGAADLSQVQVTVLDEADHMSDLGFMPAVQTLLEAVPSDGQRLLFSATLDGAVDRIVRQYLHDPVTHEVDSGQASVTTMTHHLLQLAPHHKNQVTAEIANRAGKTVIFARTQMGSDRIAAQLREAGVMAGALHGGLTQGARARILAAFKEDELPVLVATDVAARGIHVDDVSLVLQVDPPMGPKDYLHRAGRTARAGESGAVISLVLPHQRKQVRRIAGMAGVKSAPVDIEPGSEELHEATGSRAVSGTPIDEAEYQRIIAPKQQARRRPKFEGGRKPFNRGGGDRGRGRRW